MPSRRTVLAGLAAAPVAAIPAIGHVAASKDLEALIAAHADALAAFHDAIDAQQAAELAHNEANRDGFLVPDGLGSSFDGQVYGREGVKTLIGDAFGRVRELLAIYEKIAPASTATIGAAIKRKEAEALADADAIFDRQGSELAKAERCLVEASNAEDDAARALCAYRCRTLVDARWKAAYVATIPTIADNADDLFLAFLGSFHADP
jgi:hypothetical protein